MAVLRVVPCVDVAAVQAASVRLSGVVNPSPLQRSERLSQLTGRDVWLKREDLQPVRSYKLRGAYNCIAAHLETGGVSHVVTASAGNHAQGVAWCCARLQVRGTVVLPVRTPRQKRDRIAAIGGDYVDVVTAGSVVDQAVQHALELVRSTGGLWVPPFDDPLVVAGQATVGVELVSQLTAAGVGPADVVVGVGGGGLAAGVRLVVEPAGHRLTLVEPSGAACLHAAWRAGTPVPLSDVDTFVDGAAVARVGDVPFSVLSDLGGVGVTVDEGAVATAMLDLYQHDGVIAEPAGALAVTALQEGAVPGAGPVVCLVSGGNNDVSRYAEVVERSLVHRGLKHYFLVEFPQVPGALRRFLDDVLGPNADIVLFEYTKKSNRDTGPALVGIELGSRDDLSGLLERLDRSPIAVTAIEPGSPLQRFLT